MFLVRPSAGPLSHLNQADREQQHFPQGVSDGTEHLGGSSPAQRWGRGFVPSLLRLLKVLSGQNKLQHMEKNKLFLKMRCCCQANSSRILLIKQGEYLGFPRISTLVKNQIVGPLENTKLEAPSALRSHR